MRLFSLVLDTFFGARCVFCERVLWEGSICAKCRAELPYRQRPIQGTSGFSIGVAPFDYADNVRRSIVRFKFRDKDVYAKTYAPFIADKIKKELSGRYDIISWAPVSWLRRQQRRYDQAQVLARAVSKQLGAKPLRTLRKYRHTKPSSSLKDKSQRQANVRDAYRAVKPDRFRGKRVLLIDDVYTTGSTLSECARVLKAAGAKEVVCAVIAAAPSAG